MSSILGSFFTSITGGLTRQDELAITLAQQWPPCGSAKQYKELAGKMIACEDGEQSAREKVKKLMCQEVINAYVPKKETIALSTADLKKLKWVKFIPTPKSDGMFVMVDSHNSIPGLTALAVSLSKITGAACEITTVEYYIDPRTVINPCNFNEKYNAVCGIDYGALGFAENYAYSSFMTPYHNDYIDVERISSEHDASEHNTSDWVLD